MAFDYTNYYELEYLESSGTQYIDTGLSASAIYGYKIDFTPLRVATNQCYLGAYSGSSTNMYLAVTTNYASGVLSSNSNKRAVSLTASTRTEIEWANGTVYQDSVSLGSLTRANTTASNFSVFARYGSSGNTTYYGTMRLYSLTLYDSSYSASHIYIPAERMSDGTYGLYDTVSETFFANSRSGTFIPGSRVPSTSYTITVLVSPEGSGTITGGGEYPSGASVVLTATANVGYEFSRWDDNVTDNPRTITVTEDAYYTAYFSTVGFVIITTMASPNAGGTVTGGGLYSENEEVVLTATASNEYNFVGWGDGETDNPRTVIASEDVTYTAIFQINQYTITTNVSPLGSGTVNGTGAYDYGTEISLTAIANTNFKFQRWGDNTTENPKIITVSANRTITAFFTYSGSAGGGIPDGFYKMEYIGDYTSGTVSAEYSTGIIPDENTGIDITFLVGDAVSGTPTVYIFGTKNSSNGWFSLSRTSNGWVFRYGSTSTTITTIPYKNGGVVAHDNLTRLIFKNSYLTMMSGDKIYEKDFSDVVPSCQYPLMLLGYNNAGTCTMGASNTDHYPVIYAAKIWQNGELVADYIPLSDNTPWNGFDYRCYMYNLATESFTLYHAQFGGSVSPNFMVVPAEMTNGHLEGDIGYYRYSNIRAVADKGYHLKKMYYTDYEGILHETTSEYLAIDMYEALFSQKLLIVYAIFEKDAPYQDIPYKAYVKRANRLEQKANASLFIESAQFTQDLLSKATSTLLFDRIDGNIYAGDVILVYSPTNLPIFQGVVNLIEDNRIGLREIQSLFDVEYLFHANASVPAAAMNTSYTTAQKMNQYLVQSAMEKLYLWSFTQGRLVDNQTIKMDRQTEDIFSVFNVVDSELGGYNEKKYLCGTLVPKFCPQFEGTEIKNFEEWLFELYDEFGVFANVEIPFGEGTPYLAMCSPDYDPLIFSDNMEWIMDVSIAQDNNQTPTVLYVYNSAGSTLRFVYGTDSNGNAICYLKGTKVMNSTYMLPENYLPKIVMSDDKIGTLLDQYLSSSVLNHKIELTIDLTHPKSYSFENVCLGQEAALYYEGKIYNSVITGRKFNIENNRIVSLTITMGKIRNSLTSKLNMGRVK